MKRIPFLLVGLLLAVSASAAPKVDRFFPAGVARGQDVEVRAEGSFDKWPTKVWCSNADLVITPLDEKGRLRVSAPAEVPLGIHWVRLFDQEGASSSRPLLVGSLPEVVETESNATLEGAQQLSVPCTVNGRLSKGGEIDTYRLELVGGQVMVAALNAGLLGSPMDGVLQICSSDGFVVQQNDDAIDVDPMVIFRASESGVYDVRVFAFPATPNSSIGFAGASSFVYRLTVSTDPMIDHVLPLAVPYDQPTELRLFGWNIDATASSYRLFPSVASVASIDRSTVAGQLQLPVVTHPSIVVDGAKEMDWPLPIPVPSTISGRISRPGEEHAFLLKGDAGEKVFARAEASALHSLLDPRLVVSNSDGNELGSVDDSGKQRDCILEAEFPENGKLQLRLSDAFRHGGSRYYYRLSVAERTPDFRLRVGQESFVVEQGKSVEIAITVERLRGHKGQIDVSAVGLPGAVQAKTVVSEPSGDSSKTVKLTLHGGDQACSGTFRITGRAVSDNSDEREARFLVPAPKAELSAFWVTVK
jgi:hypothetical protein